MIRRDVFRAAACVVGASLADLGTAAAAATRGEVDDLFDHLPLQSPINIRADAYFEAALRLSRLAATRTRCVLDVRYGPLAANRLDIYLPAGARDEPWPVFINLHGGAWSHGYKEMMGLNAPAIVAFPAVYVSVEYRLAPAARFPAPVEDCALALAWVFRHIARFGGDPGRIHIGGHSAGAQMTSLIALRPAFRAAHGLPADVIKSCFPYCGIYDLRSMAAYGQSESISPNGHILARSEDAASASPMAWASGEQPPFFVVWAENDPPLVRAQGPAFVKALAVGGGRAESLMFPLFDHFWIHIDQERAANPWTRTLRSWMLGDPKSAAVFGVEPWVDELSQSGVKRGG